MTDERNVIRLKILRLEPLRIIKLVEEGVTVCLPESSFEKLSRLRISSVEICKTNVQSKNSSKIRMWTV